MTEYIYIAIMLKRINTMIEKNVNNVLRDHNLTMTQMLALGYLSSSSTRCCTFMVLEEVLGISQPTCFGIIQRLEQKGYVRIEEHPESRKIKQIYITKQGDECFRLLNDEFVETCRKLFSGLTEIEKPQFIAFLRNILKGMNVNADCLGRDGSMICS